MCLACPSINHAADHLGPLLLQHHTALQDLIKKLFNQTLAYRALPPGHVITADRWENTRAIRR
jgi:hypothetical protein